MIFTSILSIKKKMKVMDLVAGRALTFYNGVTALFEGVFNRIGLKFCEDVWYHVWFL